MPTKEDVRVSAISLITGYAYYPPPKSVVTPINDSNTAWVEMYLVEMVRDDQICFPAAKFILG